MSRASRPPGPPGFANGTSSDRNETLYVSNLNDKINKTLLKTTLYHLFTTYGDVLDIVALKTMKMRGQAHIVFTSAPDAQRAMRSLEGTELFGKAMKIQLAKTKSHAIANIDGTRMMPDLKPKPQAGQTAASEPAKKTIFNDPSQLSDAQLKQPNGDVEAGKSPLGKRQREDSDDEDAPMEEDDDDEGSAMEMDESDDD